MIHQPSWKPSVTINHSPAAQPLGLGWFQPSFASFVSRGGANHRSPGHSSSSVNSLGTAAGPWFVSTPVDPVVGMSWLISWLVDSSPNMVVVTSSWYRLLVLPLWSDLQSVGYPRSCGPVDFNQAVDQEAVCCRAHARPGASIPFLGAATWKS